MSRVAVAALLVVIAAACSVGPAAPSPSASGASPFVSASPSAPASTADSPDPAARLLTLLDRERARSEAPGMLAVIGHGEAIVHLASGAADTGGTRISDSTRFRIASITKPIVAALVLDAVDRGFLSLDDVVGNLLPGVVHAEPPVTVRQLLDHTSGVFDEGNEGDPIADVERISDQQLRDEARSLVERIRAGEPVVIPDGIVVALAETHDRYFAPGTGYHYSNVNYQLAAMILEQSTGALLADLLENRIARPLGLRHTSLAPTDATTPEFHGYDATLTPGKLVDVTDDLTWFGNGGNGGVISTADELLTTMQAIVSGRLVTAELAATMRTANQASYGLGLGTYTLSCGTFYGHGGAVLGTRSIALASEDGRDGVVVALNVLAARDPELPSLADRLVCPAG